MAESCCQKPGLLKMARNLASSIKDTLLHASKTGEVAADYATVEKRLTICEACPEKTGPRCRVCGCLLRLKAGLFSSRCPLNKW